MRGCRGVAAVLCCRSIDHGGDPQRNRDQPSPGLGEAGGGTRHDDVYLPQRLCATTFPRSMMARGKKEPNKAMSLRLEDELHKELAAVAKVEGVTISKVVRDALEKHIATRGTDPEFQREVKKNFEEDLATIQRLAKRAEASGDTAGDEG